MSNRQAVAALVAAVGAADDEAAETAVAQLDETDEPALVALLDSDDQEATWWAARALGSCGNETAVAPLLTLLTHEDATLRTVAAMAIGTIAHRFPDSATMPPHLEELTPLLKDSDGLTRQVAADALAQCGNMAIPALVKVLRFSPEQSARSRAAYALGKIGTMEAAPALYRCLNDQNYLVHTYAHEALDKLGLLENILMLP
ncbi:MAG: HEAT repeat domain-containing protein [Caldilineaceae bacterium]|nr:HEAT repeat domain-containing protein [Caldilineaceae bacterium]